MHAIAINAQINYDAETEIFGIFSADLCCACISCRKWVILQMQRNSVVYIQMADIYIIAEQKGSTVQPGSFYSEVSARAD